MYYPSCHALQKCTRAKTQTPSSACYTPLTAPHARACTGLSCTDPSCLPGQRAWAAAKDGRPPTPSCTRWGARRGPARVGDPRSSGLCTHAAPRRAPPRRPDASAASSGPGALGPGQGRRRRMARFRERARRRRRARGWQGWVLRGARMPRSCGTLWTMRLGPWQGRTPLLAPAAMSRVAAAAMSRPAARLGTAPPPAAQRRPRAPGRAAAARLWRTPQATQRVMLKSRGLPVCILCRQGTRAGPLTRQRQQTAALSYAR